MYLSLAHICIQTKDLDKTRKFYCETLGMSHVFNFKKDEKIMGFYLRMSEGNFLEVFHEDDAQRGCGGAYHHISFESRDIDGAHHRIKGAGIETSDITIGADRTYSFRCKDPNGVEIEVLQYTGGSCQINGTDCAVDW